LPQSCTHSALVVIFRPHHPVSCIWKLNESRLNSAFNDPLDFLIFCHCIFSQSSGTFTISPIPQNRTRSVRRPRTRAQYDFVREELGETIHLNETLYAPSARAMEKLVAAIDAEAVRAPRRRRRRIGRTSLLATASRSSRSESSSPSASTVCTIASASPAVLTPCASAANSST
jgi:hypothetical protein